MCFNIYIKWACIFHWETALHLSRLWGWVGWWDKWLEMSLVVEEVLWGLRLETNIKAFRSGIMWYSWNRKVTPVISEDLPFRHVIWRCGSEKQSWHSVLVLPIPALSLAPLQGFLSFHKLRDSCFGKEKASLRLVGIPIAHVLPSELGRWVLWKVSPYCFFDPFFTMFLLKVSPLSWRKKSDFLLKIKDYR